MVQDFVHPQYALGVQGRRGPGRGSMSRKNKALVDLSTQSSEDQFRTFLEKPHLGLMWPRIPANQPKKGNCWWEGRFLGAVPLRSEKMRLDLMNLEVMKEDFKAKPGGA